MGAILPLHALIVHQAHVGLIHQSRRLQAVTGPLAFHVAARQAAELVINDGSQPFQRALVSIAPGSEEGAYVVHSRFTRLCRPPHPQDAELYQTTAGFFLSPPPPPPPPKDPNLAQPAAFLHAPPRARSALI